MTVHTIQIPGTIPRCDPWRSCAIPFGCRTRAPPTTRRLKRTTSRPTCRCRRVARSLGRHRVPRLGLHGSVPQGREKVSPENAIRTEYFSANGLRSWLMAWVGRWAGQMRHRPRSTTSEQRSTNTERIAHTSDHWPTQRRCGRPSLGPTEPCPASLAAQIGEAWAAR